MIKEFFKNNDPIKMEKLSRERRKNIKKAVFERINETEKEAVRGRRVKLRPALIAAAAAIAAATGVTVGALSSPPDVKLNGEPIEPYYNVYTDRDGSTVEIIAAELPADMLGEEEPGRTPTGGLRLGRSEIGDISRDDYFSYWLIDENGDEYYGGINNKIVSVKITYPDNVTEIYGVEPRNLIEHNYSSGFSGSGYDVIFLPKTTEVCGCTLEPHCSIKTDYFTGALIEVVALQLPSEALGEPVPHCYFPSSSSDFISGATYKLTDDYGNKVTPVLANAFGQQEFPDGVNDLLIQVNITYPDGAFETVRIDPINKLEGFNYDEIEFNYYIASFENMFEHDRYWLRDENGDAVYQDLKAIMNRNKEENGL